jgi:hypothetical protein
MFASRDPSRIVLRLCCSATHTPWGLGVQPARWRMSFEVCMSQFTPADVSIMKNELSLTLHVEQVCPSKTEVLFMILGAIMGRIRKAVKEDRACAHAQAAHEKWQQACRWPVRMTRCTRHARKKRKHLPFFLFLSDTHACCRRSRRLAVDSRHRSRIEAIRCSSVTQLATEVPAPALHGAILHYCTRLISTSTYAHCG